MCFLLNSVRNARKFNLLSARTSVSLSQQQKKLQKSHEGYVKSSTTYVDNNVKFDDTHLHRETATES
jgi:hypothetical protein